MFRMKMMDGTPADPAYVERVGRLVSEVAAIEDALGEQALEDYAAEQARQVGPTGSYIWLEP